jgi:hypothetical protein
MSIRVGFMRDVDGNTPSSKDNSGVSVHKALKVFSKTVITGRSFQALSFT